MWTNRRCGRGKRTKKSGSVLSWLKFPGRKHKRIPDVEHKGSGSNHDSLALRNASKVQRGAGPGQQVQAANTWSDGPIPYVRLDATRRGPKKTPLGIN
ncbi:hypothetical protein ZHAS_00017507 [Anopheles sinensis]|uniref:Uncharacterized protein n=1 Tax=Anopheles sinensis TaxID=74873 RepID=A0A084WGR2_ANOSI|nr:hypothetical protein ZHAS_00017507 [Anopheles sinensis]